MIDIVQLPKRRTINRKQNLRSHTPQAWAISLVSHHFADDFGQSMVKLPWMQNIKIVESINDVYMMKRI